MPGPRGGRIVVRAHRGGEAFVLEVTDDGCGLRPGWRDGVGLANSRERLRHRFGASASLTLAAGDDGSGTVARVRLRPA